MLISYLLRLSGRERTPQANRCFALFLAFIAGTINACGFLMVERYTAHMTGIVSMTANNLIFGEIGFATLGLCALSSFILGAICATMLMQWGHQHRLESEYALPFILESALLAILSLIGSIWRNDGWWFLLSMIIAFCFIMGLQNATITKMSKSEIRTTHLTGLVTDIGIELGKLLYWGRRLLFDQPLIKADRKKLQLFALLLLNFFVGGIIGTLGFIYSGCMIILLLAVCLAILCIAPILEDIKLILKYFKQCRNRDF
jgi:uncharacterized membrane protein YoaK (UPF0700 family)